MTNLERQRKWRSDPDNMKKVRTGQSKRKARLKADGICTMCGTRPSLEGLAYCETCKSQSIDYQKQRRNEMLASNLCERCGGEQLPHSTLCETCYFKKLAVDRLGSNKHWTTLRDRLAAQQGRCAYTGEPLVLGVNASLDHILPTSRFPGRSCDPTNAEWVERRVNEMKRDRTPDEFLELIEVIITYRQCLQASTGSVAMSVA